MNIHKKQRLEKAGWRVTNNPLIFLQEEEATMGDKIKREEIIEWLEEKQTETHMLMFQKLREAAELQRTRNFYNTLLDTLRNHLRD